MKTENTFTHTRTHIYSKWHVIILKTDTHIRINKEAFTYYPFNWFLFVDSFFSLPEIYTTISFYNYRGVQQFWKGKRKNQPATIIFLISRDNMVTGYHGVTYFLNWLYPSLFVNMRRFCLITFKQTPSILWTAKFIWDIWLFGDFYDPTDQVVGRGNMVSPMSRV